MTQPNEYKEVRFDKYCDICAHKEKLTEYGSICDECLGEPLNLHSVKPVNWEEK